jgi:fatty-acyl-CoA synthase
VVEPRQGARVDAEILLGMLRGQIPDWWIPDQVVQVAAMPLAATGKIDKNQLRADYAGGETVEGAHRR